MNRKDDIIRETASPEPTIDKNLPKTHLITFFVNRIKPTNQPQAM